MRYAIIAGILLLHQGAASAGTMLITGSGAWDDTAPTTGESAPGATWSFSIDATSPIGLDGVASFSNFSYLLNGTPVAVAVSRLNFFGDADFGLFSLFLANGDVLALFGATVFDANSNLIAGSYPAIADINATSMPPAGEGSGVVVIGTAAAVPEPSSIVAATVGLILVGGFGGRHRRRSAA